MISRSAGAILGSHAHLMLGAATKSIIEIVYLNAPPASNGALLALGCSSTTMWARA